jgi:hypothetical protein
MISSDWLIQGAFLYNFLVFFEREVLAIKLTPPAICLSTIDDDFFMLGVISLFDKMQHLSIEQIYILSMNQSIDRFQLLMFFIL